MRLVLVLASVLAVVAPASATGVRTRVWIASESPLSVRGSGFAAADRVTVSASKAKVVLKKTVVATRAGTFSARWTRALPNACASTKITAAGTSGRRASYLVVMDDCSPYDPPVK